jgi:hypothetical protein
MRETNLQLAGNAYHGVGIRTVLTAVNWRRTALRQRPKAFSKSLVRRWLSPLMFYYRGDALGLDEMTHARLQCQSAILQA